MLTNKWPLLHWTSRTHILCKRLNCWSPNPGSYLQKTLLDSVQHLYKSAAEKMRCVRNVNERRFHRLTFHRSCPCIRRGIQCTDTPPWWSPGWQRTPWRSCWRGQAGGRHTADTRLEWPPSHCHGNQRHIRRSKLLACCQCKPRTWETLPIVTAYFRKCISTSWCEQVCTSTNVI